MNASVYEGVGERASEWKEHMLLDHCIHGRPAMIRFYMYMYTYIERKKSNSCAQMLEKFDGGKFSISHVCRVSVCRVSVCVCQSVA